MEAEMLELETDLLEQMALDEEMAESVWREMIEASTEAAIMLYIAPSAEEEPAEEEPTDKEQSREEEYESAKNEHGSPKLGEYEAEHKEEKSLYEKRESERRASEEEPNKNNKEVERYGK